MRSLRTQDAEDKMTHTEDKLYVRSQCFSTVLQCDRRQF